MTGLSLLLRSLERLEVGDERFLLTSDCARSTAARISLCGTDLLPRGIDDRDREGAVLCGHAQGTGQERQDEGPDSGCYCHGSRKG